MVGKTHQLPSALRANARWERLGPAGIPGLLVHPDWDRGRAVPAVIWIHGRTANKEIDPGRYLRLMRAGIGVCAVDLPGHGERFEASLQDPRHTLDVILQMIDEIDELIDELASREMFDESRLGIGGMSAGGMATLARLCQDHPFRCAAVEAATGSWEHKRHREMFHGRGRGEVADHNPIVNLEGWREIPLQAIHSRLDSWVAFEGQQAFLEELTSRYRNPDLVEMIAYDETGAPFEHVGFGRMASDAKDRQRNFFLRWLLVD